MVDLDRLHELSDKMFAQEVPHLGEEYEGHRSLRSQSAYLEERGGGAIFPAEREEEGRGRTNVWETRDWKNGMEKVGEYEDRLGNKMEAWEMVPPPPDKEYDVDAGNLSLISRMGYDYNDERRKLEVELPMSEADREGDMKERPEQERRRKAVLSHRDVYMNRNGVQEEAILDRGRDMYDGYNLKGKIEQRTRPVEETWRNHLMREEDPSRSGVSDVGKRIQFGIKARREEIVRVVDKMSNKFFGSSQTVRSLPYCKKASLSDLEADLCRASFSSQGASRDFVREQVKRKPEMESPFSVTGNGGVVGGEVRQGIEKLSRDTNSISGKEGVDSTLFFSAPRGKVFLPSDREKVCMSPHHTASILGSLTRSLSEAPKKKQVHREDTSITRAHMHILEAIRSSSREVCSKNDASSLSCRKEAPSVPVRDGRVDASADSLPTKRALLPSTERKEEGLFFSSDSRVDPGSNLLPTNRSTEAQMERKVASSSFDVRTPFQSEGVRSKAGLASVGNIYGGGPTNLFQQVPSSSDREKGTDVGR